MDARSRGKTPTTCLQRVSQQAFLEEMIFRLRQLQQYTTVTTSAAAITGYPLFNVHTVWGFCWFSHMTPYFVFHNFWTEFKILETLPLGILWGLCFRWVCPESIFIVFCRLPGGFTCSGCFKFLARNFSDSLCSKNSYKTGRKKN